MKNTYYYLNNKGTFSLIMILYLIIFIPFGSFAQLIETDPVITGINFHVEKGQAIEIKFVYPGPGASTNNWGVEDITTGFKTSTNANMSTEVYVKDNYASTCGVLRCTIPEDPGTTTQYDFKIWYGSNNGSDPNRDFHFNIHRPGAHVMLVLDRSYSMTQPVLDPNYTRWQVLVSSVNNFLLAYNLWGVNHVEDKIGVVYFDHDRVDFCIPGEDNCESELYIFSSQNNEVSQTDIESVHGTVSGGVFIPGTISPRGATCLGGGIMAAYNAFDWESHRLKHIIVFSDGLQNMEPSIKLDNNEWIITDHDYYNYDGFLVNQTLNLSNHENKLKIHTICTGDIELGAFMGQISSANTSYPGHSEVINDYENIWIELSDAYDAVFVEQLSGSSPVIVDREILQIQQDSVNKQFIVNITADRVLIKAVGSPGNMEGLTMKVEKDGQELGNLTSNGPVINFFINKNTLDSLDIEIGGIWNVTFKGKKGSKFSTTCIVNDEYIDYECTLENQNPAPGDALNLNLKVWANGVPFSNLSTAKVYVLKPRQDFNDLFSFADLPDEPENWPSEPDNFAGQDKFEKLIALDTAFVSALIPDKDSLIFSNNGDGSYSAQFTDTEESGVYKIIIKFSKNDGATGTFERYYMLTKVIDFGVADNDSSTFKIDWNWFLKKYVVRPVNKFGHLIGPNRLANITITMNGKKVKLIDNLDGTYYAKAPFFSLFKRNAIVKLDIKSANFAETKYKNLDGVVLWRDILTEVGSIVLILLILFFFTKKVIFKKTGIK